MSASELDRLARRLAKADRDERRSITGVSKDRVDLLGTGGVLLTAITEFLGVDGYTTCDWGLREGVALEYIQNR